MKLLYHIHVILSIWREFSAIYGINSRYLVRVRQTGLASWDDFRQIDWVSEIEYPELTLQQTQQLLSIPL